MRNRKVLEWGVEFVVYSGAARQLLKLIRFRNALIFAGAAGVYYLVKKRAPIRRAIARSRPALLPSQNDQKKKWSRITDLGAIP